MAKGYVKLADVQAIVNDEYPKRDLLREAAHLKGKERKQAKRSFTSKRQTCFYKTTKGLAYHAQA